MLSHALLCSCTCPGNEHEDVYQQPPRTPDEVDEGIEEEMEFPGEALSPEEEVEEAVKDEVPEDLRVILDTMWLSKL